MCGAQAESIAAPPPIYPGPNALAWDCAKSDSGSFTLREARGTPTELSNISPQAQQQPAILSAPLAAPPRRRIRARLPERERNSGEDHPRPLLRPPLPLGSGHTVN